jgi:hypothetical protein
MDACSCIFSGYCSVNTLPPSPSLPMEARLMNEMYSHAKHYDAWTNHVVAPEFYDETWAELWTGLSEGLALEFLYMFKTVLKNTRQSCQLGHPLSWSWWCFSHTRGSHTHPVFAPLHLPHTSFASPGLGSWGFKLKEKHPTKEMRDPISGCC